MADEDDPGLGLRAALSHLDLAVANMVMQTQQQALEEEVSSVLREHGAALTDLARSTSHAPVQVPSYLSRSGSSTAVDATSRGALRRGASTTSIDAAVTATLRHGSGTVDLDDILETVHEHKWVCIEPGAERSTEPGAERSTSRGNIYHYNSAQSESSHVTTLADMEIRRMALRTIFSKLCGKHNSVNGQSLREALVEEGIPESVLVELAQVLNDGAVDQTAWFDAVDSLSDDIAGALTSVPIHKTIMEMKTRSSAVVLAPPEVVVPRFMVHHLSTPRSVWDMFMTFLLLYVAFVLPFRYGFLKAEADREPLDNLDQYLDWFFVADIIFNFRTTYSNEEGIEVVKPWLVARHYLRTWFVIDLVSSVPYDQMANGLPGLQPMKLLKVGKVSKVFKVLRVARVLRINSTIQNSMEMIALSSTFTALVNLSLLLLLTFVLCHWVACFMAVSGEGFTRDYVGDSPFEQYLAAFYWAMTTLTTVGYGDMIPTNNWERFYAVLAMILGCGFYGYILGNISFFVHHKNINERAFIDRMGLVQAWLSYHGLPRETSRRILRHFKMLLRQKAAIDEVAIMNDLSPELAKEVSEILIPSEIRHAKVFKGLQTTMLSHIARIVRQHTSAANTLIVDRGSQGVGMFMIHQGQARLDHWRTASTASSEAQESLAAYAMLEAEDTWGEEILLGITSHYKYSVQCVTEVTLLVLPVDRFRQTFSHYRDALNAMRKNYTGKEREKSRSAKHHYGRSSIFATPGVLPPHFADTVLDYFDDITQRIKWLEFEVARPR